LHNVRDLGGHPTQAGGLTKFGGVRSCGQNVDRLTDGPVGGRSSNTASGPVVDLRFARRAGGRPPVDLPIVLDP
jgi:hypothetical protein